jgi:hypothetical protein
MNHRPFRFTIYAKLPQRKESPAEIGAKFLNAVDALTRIDHLFADWEVLDLPAMQSLPLSDARPRIAEIVENNVVRDRHGVPQPKSGYHGIGVTQNVAPSRVVTLRAEAGALFGRGIRLEFGDILNPTDPLILSYPSNRRCSSSWRRGCQLGRTLTPSGWTIGKHRSFPVRPDSLFSFPHPLDRVSVARGE